MSTTAVVLCHNETSRDYPMQNTAVQDVGDQSNLVVNIPEIESDRRQSVSTASSSESATSRHMQPAPPTNAAHEYSHRSESPNRNMGGNILAANNDKRWRKWLFFMVVTYLTAIGISLQALETMKNVPQLPNSFQFHYCRMFLVISLVYLIISTFVRLFSVPAAVKIEQLAVSFGFLAFILVITIPDFPSEVIKVSSATFIVPLFIVFIVTYICQHG